MPLGRGGVGVIGHPVAKTAVVAAAVTPGPSPVAKAAVVGAGTMGNGITQVFAASGFDVTMVDVSDEFLKRGLATIDRSLDRLVKKETLSAGDKAAILGRIATATAVLLAVAAYFLEMPGLALAVSGLIALLSAGLILFETSRIVNGGEPNYVMATVSLYVSVFNLFVSLLQLMGLGGDE
mgnify:CR=1 FL=1